MPRKLSALLDYKLRIRESLRRRIEQAARKRGASLNNEMARRLEHSFDQEALRDIDDVRSDLAVIGARFGEALHDLNKQGDLLRALEKLINALPADVRERTPIKEAVADAMATMKTIDTEAALALRRMHTTGQRVE
jgi:hypothetical protein